MKMKVKLVIEDASRKRKRQNVVLNFQVVMQLCTAIIIVQTWFLKQKKLGKNKVIFIKIYFISIYISTLVFV